MNQTRLLVSILTLAFTTLTACSNSSSDSNPNPAGGQSTTSNTTNTAICKGATPPGTTVYSSWKLEFTSSDGMSLTSIMTIEPNAIEVTQICRYGGQQAIATARANASISSSTILATSNAQDATTEQSGSQNITCRVEIQSGKQISYSFQGPCLKGISEGQTVLMVPAN